MICKFVPSRRVCVFVGAEYRMGVMIEGLASFLLFCDFELLEACQLKGMYLLWVLPQ